MVVICLKNRTFAVSQTTSRYVGFVCVWLWFAWKIVLLQYRKQQGYARYAPHNSCDLLEKSYFCSIANNCWCKKANCSGVVICLKNRTFAVSQTTKLKIKIVKNKLWFAWKIVLLQYRKQHNEYRYNLQDCCDLLEKSYFCSIANNKLHKTNWLWQLWFAWKIVLLQYRKQQSPWIAGRYVCCDLLEKSYFCSIANNIMNNNRYICKLWFAWKIVLLQYRKQQLTNKTMVHCCCDLLEKSYFCSIANNNGWVIIGADMVVICLKNRTFAVSQTT